MPSYLQPRPLSGADDIDQFDCGRDALNSWLRRYALRNQTTGASRTSVICDDRAGLIAGYVSLSAAHIEREALPKKLQRNMPDPVPAVLLGQLAVDRRSHKQGLATSLLYFAFKTTVRISEQIGCVTLLTHPLDEDVRTFYRKFDFADLPSDPTAMYARVVDMKKNGF